jgi:hypothetical protein
MKGQSRIRFGVCDRMRALVNGQWLLAPRTVEAPRTTVASTREQDVIAALTPWTAHVARKPLHSAEGHEHAESMASGFITLRDGRCLAVRWTHHDAVVAAIAAELDRDCAERELASWLRSRLPGPDDIEHLGHGPWLRKRDGATIPRNLDLRAFASLHRERFEEGALRAAQRRPESDALHAAIARLADMILRARRGEPPLELSDLRDVMPCELKRDGPGSDEPPLQ